MARARRVTRQRIQTLVNSLLSLDLLATRKNPASRRSPLIELTDTGRRTIRAMRRREADALRLPLEARALRQAARTLAAVREAVEQG
jgi:DNA-binding MarR family transcriptional regulator